MYEDLTEDMVKILYYLFRKGRFKFDRSFPQKMIIKVFEKKVNVDIKEIIKYMVNVGYLAQMKKKGEIRHWVDVGQTKRILFMKGYDV